MIEVRTLGETTIRHEGDYIRLATRKQYALLVYLACHQGRIFRRDQLTSLLWGESETSHARHSLSQTLYGLRKQIPTLRLHAKGEDIWFDEGTIQVDWHLFEKAIAEHRLQEASAFYRGDFLEGFWVESAPVFEEWQESERNRLHRTAKNAMRRLLDKLEAEGDWLEIELQATRLLEFDPFDEAVQRIRIVAIAQIEGRKRALEELKRFEHLIQLELGREPEVSTTQLAHQLEEGELRPVDANDANDAIEEETVTPMVGRAREFTQLREEWANVKAGLGRAVIILGEPGIGKTRLCRHLLRMAVLQNGRVFYGRCYPTERQIPYSGIVDALLSSVQPSDIDAMSPAWSAVVAELIPEVTGSRDSRVSILRLDGEGARRRLFEGLARLLRTISERSPVVFFIDDFHWADDSTAALAHYLARRLADCPALLLLALRFEDINTESTSLADIVEIDALFRRIHLSELGPNDVEQLMDHFEAHEHIGLPGSVRQQIYSVAGGRPFLILEMLKAKRGTEAIRSERHVSSDQQVSQCDIPASIEEFVKGRLNALSPEAMQLVSSLAVLGKQAAPHLVQEVSGLTTAALFYGLQELTKKGIIRDQETEVTFTHDLIREAVYRSMSGSGRRLLHGAAATALRYLRDSQPGTLALHYDLAGNRTLAYDYSLLASEASRRLYAHRETEFFLRMALANASGEEEKMTAQERLGSLLFELRRFSEAEQVFLELEARWRRHGNSEGLLELETKLTSIHAIRCTVPAQTMIERLLELETRAEACGAYEQLVRISTTLVDVGHNAGNRDVVLHAASRLIQIAQISDTSETSLRAMIYGANAIGFYQTLNEAIIYCDEAVRRAESLANPGPRILAFASRAKNRLLMGMVDLASSDFDVALRMIEEFAEISFLSSTLNNYGVLLLEKGEYERADHILGRALEMARAADASQELLFLYGNLMILTFESGDMGRSRALGQQVLSLGGSISAWWCNITAWSILGLCALARGQFAEANQCRREVLLRFEDRDFWVSDTSYAETFLARLAAMEGESENALGRLDRAIAAYEGRDVFCRSRLQLERARLLMELDPEGARRQAGEVRSRAVAIGARPLVEKADWVLDRLA